MWGRTTVNLNNGYAFQIFGGGELGVVGKKNMMGEYEYDPAFSTTVNLRGTNPGYPKDVDGPKLAETEYIYGGGNEGDVCGDSYVYLGNGRIYDAFGGASNADILGATEVYIGHNGGFPWVRDNIYGGNDFGGSIWSKRNHTMETSRTVTDASLLQSSTYVKYIQGRVDTIFGGNYGNYNYKDRVFKDYTDADGVPLIEDGKPVFTFPYIAHNSFVHFIPEDHSSNSVNFIFGGSEGFPDGSTFNNTMQEQSYVLIDDTKTKDANRFGNLDIYGGGAFAGMGHRKDPDDDGDHDAIGAGRTAVDLFAGSFNDVYGGCNREGLIGYTRVNVPAESTVKLQRIFGGGLGYNTAELEATPTLSARYCDNYVTSINYLSPKAIIEDAIYGGNRNCRISCDTYINIGAPVKQSSGYDATVYGAGYGDETVSGRTNIFMNNASKAYKVFGGGRDGNVFNYASLIRWLSDQFVPLHPVAEAEGATPEEKATNVAAAIATDVMAYGDILRSFGTYIEANPITFPSGVGTYPNGDGVYDGTYTNDIMPTNLLVDQIPEYHQTNVHLMDGSTVSGYAYGGGFGENAVVGGTTYIELKGGTVDRDIYGGGQGGSVYDEYGLVNDGNPATDFVATTNVYIEGGMVRNVYGGGYLGHVGKHTGGISDSYASDIPAVANVTIGTIGGTTFFRGVPAIMRNAYGGGEGGSVYGRANLTINNGYIGYRYKNLGTPSAPNYQYVEELDDKTANAIVQAGNAFGGGYVVNSYVDTTHVHVLGGIIRGSVYGGGEIGPIGRGTMKSGATGGVENGKAHIYKAGKTHVAMYDGWVKRNVFGGGRGHDSWGGDGTMYMDEALKPTLDMKSKGNVYGQTEVDIYGGEIGTEEGVAEGYGNVFGACDIGSVYSAYELADGTLGVGKQNGARYDGKDNSEGYYYKNEGGTFITSGSEYILTEDCKVLVEPWCKAKEAITIHDKSFAAGEYVPTAYLNYLGNKNDADWETLLHKDDVNKEGIIIHNAVFAGGNTSPGSTEVYANTTTVFGNATASIHDAYHRDLITIGTGHTGGLYGDGNLTLVDGYRELNITNYGTDYYHIEKEISYEDYKKLPIREGAYYEIRYRCLQECQDKDGRTYAIDATITADQLQDLFEGVKVMIDEKEEPMLMTGGKPQPTYWIENGVCSRYAGRIMNTIQRADFCGVFGSRMVMRGAQDRVPETVDYTNYTINRVREVSLNKKASVRSADARESGDEDYWRLTNHGNYFGIYSVVNFLGALTSDLDFHTAKRVTDNTDAATYKCATQGTSIAYGTATYHDWKKAYHDERRRNNGNSHNKLALASGVYLELTSEKGTGKGLNEKDWGPITGVVELDLINVQPGMGGGYVYAKNIHGKRVDTGKEQTILTELNKNTATGERAATNKHFRYDDTQTVEEVTSNTQDEWETSGNFVHSTQTIIDDCYNLGGRYKVDESPVPAHYWYIKGAVYVYDQYISAYTGSPNAYSEIVNIPLTITSASHGRMKLVNVQPSYYAYYSVNNASKQKVLGANEEVAIREDTYRRNDAINYWDYSQLTATEKALFVKETIVTSSAFELGTAAVKDTIYAGSVMLPTDSTTLRSKAEYVDITDDGVTNPVPVVKKMVKDEEGNYVVATDNDGDPIYLPFESVFHSSNNVSHDTGYILTYNIDNPSQWNKWYTNSTNAADKKQVEAPGYIDAPTYSASVDGLFGQHDYSVGAIIPQDIYLTYKAIKDDEDKAAAIPAGQATFYPAFIVTDELVETKKKVGDKEVDQRLHKGATIPRQDYSDATWSTLYSSKVDSAYVVTKTIQLSKTDFVYRNTYMSKAEKETLYAKYYKGGAGNEEELKLAKEIKESILPAYYCTEAGKYGGNYYKEGNNYRALVAFCSMPEDDREKFNFNYDALDLLIDPEYSRPQEMKYQYDGPVVDNNHDDKIDANDVTNKAEYSLPAPIDYTATYKGDTKLTYTPDSGPETDTDTRAELTRTEYERLPNEQFYWAPISVATTGDYYVVTETIVLGDTPYAAGQVISYDTYQGLGTTEKEKVKKLNLTSYSSDPPTLYYYCRESFTIDSDNYATSPTLTDVKTEEEYTSADAIPQGAVISSTDYDKLINKQKNFAIHGLAPTETSTFYVTRNSDINDLSAEKIITVIYKYDYVESDMSGQHITPVSEYHVLNIHLTFKSGVPTVEDIKAPEIILPGTFVSIPEPYVTPGAYEITGGGWTLFDNESDAESHINGVEYTPAEDPLFLYQNKTFLAYYAKTYLGKTYSNHVPVSVANYHDLKAVMSDTLHHYYIDHKDVHDVLKVEPKIYINDYSGSSLNGLTLFKNLYDLSLLTNSSDGVTDGIVTATGPLQKHSILDRTRVGAGKNLEFFLRTDITAPSGSPAWTPIGSEAGTCFEGTLHGDGHTLSGLDNSLFNHLCGDVYNLGVQGTFTTAGIAEQGSGYVENCWIGTTSKAAKTSKPVFNAPSRTSEQIAAKGAIQMVNTYYKEEKDATNPYTNHAAVETYGLQPTRKPAQAFYHGEVAFDLNSSYLNKRYYDNNKPGSTQEYMFLKSNADGTLPEDLSTGYYPATPDAKYGDLEYVTKRFADGDYRFAGGSIPSSEDMRAREGKVIKGGKEVDTTYFAPIWPDDYLFFGQKLTYGYSATQAHDTVPTAIVRFDDRLSKNPDANRVYRAPAYFRSKDMNFIHFNPQAYLAAKSKDGSKNAYPGMTAVDFKGHNDTSWAIGSVSDGFPVGKPAFYTPLLDDDGLLSIVNEGETKNLLVYSPSSVANEATHDVLAAYFVEPEYSDYYTSPDKYRKVAKAPVSSIYGHLVQHDLVATNDHLLVDTLEFNCPIAYSFDKDHLMWYQRDPSIDEEKGIQEFVDRGQGWMGVSIPFTAELVTTNDKGEITHFYSGSETSKNSTDSKIGHEYWLREFSDISVSGDVATADLMYPTAIVDGDSKTVTNTFLWDYYYQNTDVHNRKDFNADTLQQYYNFTRNYEEYPLLTAATPYIIGLPGKTYYEFDLSGNFTPEILASPVTKLERQTITFASKTGASIEVSDTELPKDVTKEQSGSTKDFNFTFHTNYLKQDLTTADYALKADGSQFDHVTAAGGSGVSGGATALPFRPYFTATSAAKGGSVREMMPSRIVFSGILSDKNENGPESDLEGGIEIYTRGRSIITKSNMKVATTVNIVSVSGVTVTTYVLEPGQVIETPVHAHGTYIVNRKKVFIK